MHVMCERAHVARTFIMHHIPAHSHPAPRFHPYALSRAIVAHRACDAWEPGVTKGRAAMSVAGRVTLTDPAAEAL